MDLQPEIARYLFSAFFCCVFVLRGGGGGGRLSDLLVGVEARVEELNE